MVALPNGIDESTDLIRLMVKKYETSKIHENTSFTIKIKEKFRERFPFDIRHDIDGSAIIYTTKVLDKKKTYNIKVQARSLRNDGKIEYKTTFIIYVSVSGFSY